MDSPLEEAGYEPSVPRKTPAVVVISALVAPPSPLRQAEPTRAPLSKPWSSHPVLTVRSGLFQRSVRRTLRAAELVEEPAARSPPRAAQWKLRTINVTDS